MPYMYQADLWCDSCGEAIRKRLDRQGKTPAAPDDEYSYDSDDYPKYVIAGESDCPEHCAAGEECLEAVELPSGRKIGALLSDQLTVEGVEYVEEAKRDLNEVVAYWSTAFACII